MEVEQHIFCGGLVPPRTSSSRSLNLNILGSKEEENVLLRIEDLKKSFYQTIASQLLDLVEIAAYVYAADQATTRCYVDADRFGDDWRRDFHFHIPVRKPGLWKSKEVSSALRELLSFLSDDYFTFEFSASNRPADWEQQYLGFENDSHDGRSFDQVVMFSGGLDSLAGAMEEILTHKNRIVLVTHVSTPKNHGFLQSLQAQIAEKAAQAKPHHVHVHANKVKRLGREHTQRTRSFLFASFGATIAKMLNLDSMRFYENGVVSLNFPLSAQVIGSRATRTTHPRVLHGFERLFSAINESSFTVENPFIQETKAGVIQKLIELGCGEMLKTSISCAHTWERTKQHTHCGRCSQCIDRRIAMVAAGASRFDPLDQYAHNIFIEDLPKDEDKMMLAGYLDRATKAESLRSVSDLLVTFPQVVDALPYLSGGATKAAEKIFGLYKRHAAEVHLALGRLIEHHQRELVFGQLGSGSLLRAMTDQCGIAAATVVKNVELKPECEPSNADVIDRISQVQRALEGKQAEQEQIIKDMAGGSLEFLKKLGVKLSTSEHQLFLLLVEPVTVGASERVLTYEEIALKLCGKGKKPVSKQAIGKRVAGLKKRDAGLKKVIDEARQPTRSTPFSELSPRERRRNGIDDSYGHHAAG